MSVQAWRKNMALHWLRGFIYCLAVVTATAFYSGCSRAPSKFEYLRKTVELKVRYINAGDPSEAISVLSDYEDYVLSVKRRGTGIPNVELDLANVYARLYLVNSHLGHHEVARGYYEKSVQSWREFDRQVIADRKRAGSAGNDPTDASADLLRARIEGVDRQFESEIQWKRAK